MFKLAILALCLVAVWAKPAEHDAQIVHQESDVGVDGKFHYSFEASDGTKVEQSGELKGAGEEAGEAIVGSFEYKDPEGKTIHTEYTADVAGYVAHGDHIPAVPEYIERALKWAAEHPYKEPAH